MCVFGAQVKDAPKVTWPTEAGAMYSLVMTGLCAGSAAVIRSTPTCSLHAVYLHNAHAAPTHTCIIHICTELVVLTR